MPVATQTPYSTGQQRTCQVAYFRYDQQPAVIDNLLKPGIRSGFFYFLTRLMGYDRTSNYDGSILDWAAGSETTYPMEKLKNYEKLVYPGWVKQLLDGDITPSGTDGYLVVEI